MTQAVVAQQQKVGGLAGTTVAAAGHRGLASSALSHMKTAASMDAVVKEFGKHRACAVLRTPFRDAVAPAMQAAIDGGFKCVEFTLTTPGCLDVLADFAKKEDVLVGCGTVMNVEHAEQAMEAGAKFLVSPIVIPEVVTWCAERNIVCLPGCQTPTELYTAYKLGAPIQKLFPGVAGGPMWVKAVSAALPMLRINPTSGVEKDTGVDYIRSGAYSLGYVAPAFPPALMEARDYAAIEKNAAEIIAKLKPVL
jgi:Entner-Doudoroff aldolase